LPLPRPEREGMLGRLTQEVLRRLAPSTAVLNKILWENAHRLLALDPVGK